MQKKMKEIKEQLKQRIINDVKSRTELSISWLQKKYGIAFAFAKEIYCECEKQVLENNLRYKTEAIATKLPKDRANALIDEMNKVISNGGAQRIVLASLIAATLRSKQIQYIVTGNLSSSYLAYELKIHNVDCFKYGIRPEICYGIDYKNNYTLEFRVAPEEIPKILSLLDKKLKGHLLREFKIYENGMNGVVYLSRYYVVNPSIRSLAEDRRVVEGGRVKYESCINNEIAWENENRDKLIRITICGSTTLSIVYNCKRKIEESLNSLGKKRKGIIYLFDKKIQDSPDLFEMLMNSDENFYLPRLANDFINWFIKETNEKPFSDFVKIMSVTHSTGAWKDNQEILYRDRKRSINLLIGSRDDVFDFAISKGISVKESLEIMELVRKGKGVDERYREILGDEYFNIFNKIKYLFPKGHILQLIQTELLALSFRKNHPIEFFASRLELYNIHKMFDETLLNGDVADLKAYIENMQNKYSQLDTELKEHKVGEAIKDKIRFAKLLILIKQEGIKLLKPDFNKSSSNTVLIDYDNKALLLPLLSLPISEAAAKIIITEREKGRFKSLEHLRRRTGISATSIEELNNAHFFDDFITQFID